MSRARTISCLLLYFVCATYSLADEPTLQYSKWSGDINVPDPVAIGFDDQGRAYVTQTQRRKSQDLDIRANREWIPSDVGLQTVTDKIEFYQRELAIGDDEENAKHVTDMNKDGKHDFRDLTVLSEKIHVLEDTDQNGTADSIKEFAANFRTEVTGIAAGVMHHQGEVYATIAPDVWKLRDRDNDGSADEREKLATGFGLHIAYAGHDMHGLTVGPDGKIYWSVGDKGISATSKEGKRFHYPNQGGVMRCNPDGSDFEVFAHGLRNVQELAFDQWGNLFGVDNDADKSGERERFVYIVKGMDAGWRCSYQYRGKDYDPWMAEKLWQPWHAGQPSYIIPPISHSIDGPAGFAFNPGTALSPKYKDYFFLTGAPAGNQIAFRVEADRASFQMVDEHKIGSGVPLVGINFAPDGALYGVDWGGGYPLNQTGAVWKIDDPEFEELQQRKEVRKLLSAGFEHRDSTDLAKLLGHADQRVRLGAQFELADRNALDEFNAAISDDKPMLVRVHGIWGLGQLARTGNRDARARLHSAVIEFEEPEVIAQTLRTLRDTKDANGVYLGTMLTHTSPRVRFMTASLLAEHSGGSLLHIENAAKRTRMDETYMRYSLARALARSATEDQIVRWKNKPDEVLQLLAVVALRQQRSAKLGEFTYGTSDVVATEAALAIHDDFSVPGAMRSLARGLTSSECETEPFVRRAINANYRIGDAACTTRLLDYVLDTTHKTKYRVAALVAIGAWEDCPPLDFVTGRARTYGVRQTPDDTDLADVFSRLMVDDDAKVAALALSLTAKLGVEVDSEVLADLVRDEDEPNAKRIEAMRLLGDRKSWDGLAELLKDISSRLDSEMRIASLGLIRNIDRDDAMWIVRETLLERNTKRRFSSSMTERQMAVTLFGELAETKVELQMLADYVLAVKKGKSEVSDIRLEILEAAELRRESKKGIDEMLTSYNQEQIKRAAEDPVAAYYECLQGGHAKRGKELFFNHLGAQCVRCHKVGTKGSDVGPNLDGVAARRDPKYLLRAIVAPSIDIDEKYQSTTVMLDSGKTVQGVVLRADDEVTVLLDAEGKEVKIDNESIEETFKQEVSIMPEMNKVLSRREIRDVLAYLKSLR